MELIEHLETLFKEPLIQFFIWMAIIYLLANIFIDKRLSFWVSSLGTTWLWVKNRDPFIALQVWGIILGLFLLYLGLKYFFHMNVFLFLKGRKRCPLCWEEAHRRAKVCPHCGFTFEGENGS